MRKVPFLRKYFPVAVFLSVALASLIMAGFAFFATEEASRFKFEATADDALNRIQSRIELNLALLSAAHAFAAAENGDVSREKYETFYRSLGVDDRTSGLRGIGFLRVVNAGAETGINSQLARSFGSPSAVWPETDQKLRAAVTLFEPYDEASSAGIGFDMFTDPLRREAIQAAIATGEAHATGRILLGKASGDDRTPGFIVFLHLGQGSLATASVTDDGSSMLYAAFRATDLFNAALGRAPLLPVNAEAYVGKPTAENLLYRSETPPQDPENGVVVTRNLKVAGQTWTILFRPSGAFAAPASKTVPVMLGLFGLLLAMAIAFIARYRERAYEAVALMQENAERSLFEKDLMLQEMKHRIKNSITRVLAIARQTAAGASDVADFSASFGSRLQAMAASQDMLTRSRWQKAELAELLRIELGQVFGKDLPEDMLSGPRVLLDEATTQALGLTFHELATNALKYGDIAGLKVSWRVERPETGRRLVLQWEENGLHGITKPEKAGFGTKLIDMNVTRELDGSIERDFRDEGLRISINVPV